MTVTIEDLIAKLRRIEALHAGATTQGEQSAAEAARLRIIQRMREIEAIEKPTEYQLSLPDPWKRQLFIALARRYDLKPFRYKRQRHSTVMLRVQPSFMDDNLWPSFRRLADELGNYLQDVTNKVIAEAINGDMSDLAQETQLSLPQ